MSATQTSVMGVPFKRIAFIGAGQMGGRVARLLMRTGHELTVCDPAFSVRQAFEGEGATVAETPADCAAADMVIIFVMNGEQALDVVLGNSGLLSGIDAASPPLVLVMSTILPNDALKIAAALAPKGVHTIDAPVTGGLTLAEQGRLLLLVGGDSNDIDKAQPVLALMGREIIRCGPFGAGLTAKILNNMLGTSNLYLMQECYRLGMAYGLSAANVAAILEKGAGQNFWTRDPGDSIVQFDLLSRQRDYFGTVLKASVKDWAFAVALADKVEMKLPFLGAMISAVTEVDGDALHNDWRKFIDAQPNRVQGWSL